MKVSGIQFEPSLVIISSASKEFKEIKKNTEKFSERELVEDLWSFMSGEPVPKICVITGLRGTGKTTMMFQAMSKLADCDIESIYMSASPRTSYLEFLRKLTDVLNDGWRYVFIDEITYVDGYHEVIANLANGPAAAGVKIVVSGTNSFGLELDMAGELFHRYVCLRTTEMTFAEYADIFPNKSLDSYLVEGGILSVGDVVDFSDLSVDSGYFYTAVCKNIADTVLHRSHDPSVSWLVPFAENGALYSLLHKVAQLDTHLLLSQNVDDAFKSALIGRVNRTLKNRNMDSLDLRDGFRSNSLRVDLEEEIAETLAVNTFVKLPDKERLRAKQCTKIAKQLENLLHRIDVTKKLISVDVLLGVADTHYVLAQPGLFSAHVIAAVRACNNIPEFVELPLILKEQANGFVLENVVHNDVLHYHGEQYDVFKITLKSFENNVDLQQEIDVVMRDKKSGEVHLFEVKNSKQADEGQTKHLMDDGFMSHIEKVFGPVVSKCVLYRGDNFTSTSGVRYLNVEEFLKELKT